MGCCLGRDRGGSFEPRNDGVLRVWERRIRWRDLVALVLFWEHILGLRAENSQVNNWLVEAWFFVYWIGERDGSPWFARALPGDEV